MTSFKNFLNCREAFQVGVEKDYQYDMEEIFQAAKFFIVKNPKKMKDFLIKEAERDNDLKSNIHFSSLLNNNKDSEDDPIKPLGDFVGYDMGKPTQSPIGDLD